MKNIINKINKTLDVTFSIALTVPCIVIGTIGGAIIGAFEGAYTTVTEQTNTVAKSIKDFEDAFKKDKVISAKFKEIKN